MSVWDRRDAELQRYREAAVQAVGECLPRALELLRSCGCTEVWLVGSFAAGTPGPTSDVDLLVRALPTAARSDCVDALEHLFRRQVDLAELERVPPERLHLAMAGGRRLYP